MSQVRPVDTQGHTGQRGIVDTIEQGTIDVASPAFARRLASMMIAARRQGRTSRRRLARSSGGRFSIGDLRAHEAGNRILDDHTVVQLSALYGCDLSAITPVRTPLSIEYGRITAAGVSVAFEPLSATSALDAYLRLVRLLRRQRSSAAVELRRDDIEALAAHLHEPGDVVVERLGALMGATRGQRTAMAGLFATGAVVIGLVGGATAAAPELDSGDAPAPIPVAVSATAATDWSGAAVPIIDLAADTAADGIGSDAAVIDTEQPVAVQPDSSVDADHGDAADGAGCGESLPDDGWEDVAVATDADGNLFAVGAPPMPPELLSDDC